jgi:hydroxyethylthiazole kinase-like uncharacterized protein yjeF
VADSINIQKWDLNKAKPYISKPTITDNKYRRGVLGCYTGDRKFPGAALISSAAALATGVGMVRFLGPRSIRKTLIQYRPAVVLANGPVDALLIGSGVRSNLLNKYKLAKLNKFHIPKVLDAGAIYLANSINSPTVITPHSGELAKFLGVKSAEIEENPLHYAQIAAEKTGATVLLKGNRTVVVNKKRAIELPPAPTWLATAGTGDVLAGILGALIAINKNQISDENLVEVSATASLIHALAAESASPASIDIEALIQEIPEIISRN